MIEIKDLCVTYRGEEKSALDTICFEVSKGEHVALIGANGAGKSTLLKTMAGILPKAKGSIGVNGVVLEQKTEMDIRKNLGLVFQNPDDQLFMARVWEDVAFGPSNYGKSGEELNEIVDRTLALLGILDLKQRSTTRLSYGEKRLVALACVLAMEPKVLLFDEPSSFLDPKGRRLLIAQLKRLEQTQLIATHDFDLIGQTCSRVLVLDHGRMVADGRMEEVLSDEALLSRCDLL